MKRLLFLLMSAVLPLRPVHAGVIMYGGNGGHNNGDSINDGWLVTIDQTTGAVTGIGHPTGVSRISGLAFDLTGALFATTLGSGGFPPPPGPTTFSNLMQLNPSTGAIIANIGTIRDGAGTAISIADLAVQPDTGVLYGIRAPLDQLNAQGRLYTINQTTGVATLVGDTGDFFGSIAFAPNGTLYMSSADLDPITGNLINIGLKTLNPATAATLTFKPTADFFGALGVRPDGVIFGGTGDSGLIFTINSATGGETLIGSTGRNFVGDIAFQVPEPGTLALFSIGLLVVGGYARRNRSAP